MIKDFLIDELKNFAGLSSQYPHTGFETVPPNEAEQIEEITRLTVKLLMQRYPEGMARRGVHPKDHGCVWASFTVNPDIPEAFRVGVFSQPGRKYDAWIRFSNAAARLEKDVDDKGANASRGMAIKLMGVEGETLLDEPGAKTQDFLMINLPVFAFADVAEYLELTRVQLAHNDDIKPFFASQNVPKEARDKTLGIVAKIQRTPCGNPLESPYFSASPFLFGPSQAVKFAVRPRNAAVTPVPEHPSPNYLREAMKKSLDPATGAEAFFDFLVQPRTGPNLAIEDAATEWKEEDAPFHAIATIAIGRQDFDNPPQVTECEHMTFTPWHGLKAHQPLGGINRLRRTVYLASSQFRLQAKEPSGFPDWATNR
jgi:hypothetical protein